MADAIVLDRTLRPHVFDEQNWKILRDVLIDIDLGSVLKQRPIPSQRIVVP
jgi:hypothetical protein